MSEQNAKIAKELVDKYLGAGLETIQVGDVCMSFRQQDDVALMEPLNLTEEELEERFEINEDVKKQKQELVQRELQRAMFRSAG